MSRNNALVTLQYLWFSRTNLRGETTDRRRNKVRNTKLVVTQELKCRLSPIQFKFGLAI